MLTRRVQLLALLYISIFVSALEGQQQQDYCYTNDGDKKQTKHYSTKTPYEIVRGTDKKYFSVPKCEAVKFWILSRHGTRNPSEKSIDQLRGLDKFRDAILENFGRSDRDRGPNQLCSEDLDILKRWRFDTNLTTNYADYLTVQGWNDLKYMAIDYQRTFQNVLDHKYSRDKFRFAYTDTQRTYASYKAFVEGLFGPGADNFINASVETNQSILLRPYEHCEESQNNKERAKAPDSEYEKFKDSEPYRRTADEISKRLAFKYTLQPKQIDLMFDMCRYDQAWYLQDESAWCAAFTPEHINVLEYLEDLKYYVKGSYGSPTNSKVMCAAMKDMVKFLLEENGPKVSAYFSHATAIQLFLTSLGYAKDDKPLTADSYYAMKKSRKFTTSTLSPLASNLAVVKYECRDEPERFKVQFFLNERLIEFNWCNIGLCNLSAVQKAYKEFLEADCAKYYCDGSSSGRLSISFVFITAVVSLVGFLM